MTASNIANRAISALKSNSPQIFTAIAASGVVTTAYLTAKASFKASRIFELRVNRTEIDIADGSMARLKEQTKLVWKLYIPPVMVGASTIGCIVLASKSSARRTAAAVTAYSLTERAFSEYREKVIEQIGKGKERKVRDAIVQDRILNKPPGNEVISLLGANQVLCCELFTHRYFRSDMEALRRAVNSINSNVINERYVTLDDFYDLIGLDHTSESDKIGWNSDQLMDLDFTTVLTSEGVPCLAFAYNYTKPI